VPAAIASVIASHALVVDLARPTPLNPHADLPTPQLFRIAPHLLVQVTTTATGSPTSPARTTRTIVPTTTAAVARHSDNASTTARQRRAVTHDVKTKKSPKRATTHAKKRSTHTSSPIARSTASASPTTSRSRVTTRTTRPSAPAAPTSSTTTPSRAVPDGFASWSPKKQWQWLRQSGQHVSYGQWKAAVRQAESSVKVSDDRGRDRRGWPGQGHVGKHRR
jgi:hypothetical protein